jgi:hypothetical protein
VEKMTGRYRKQEMNSITSRWGLLAGICTSPLFILFAYFGDAGRGRAAWIGAAIVFVIVRGFWGLRARAWFWLTVAIIALFHVPLVLFIPWGNQPLTYVALLPVGLLDFAIDYEVIRLAERAFETKQVSN